MTLIEITRRNYEATVKRGLITEFTRKDDFILKMYEEVTELAQTTNEKDEEMEMGDVISSCLTFAYHYNIDIIKSLENVVIKNENRKD